MNTAVVGANANGQYGAGYAGGGFLHMPCRATHMEALLGGVDSVATTYGDLYALRQGKLGFCGGDFTGVSGNGVRKRRYIEPMIVPIDEAVLQVAVAGSRWTALLASGRLAAGGGNVYGNIGDGTSGEGHEANGSPVPIYLNPGKPVKAVVNGGGTNGRLHMDGTIATWGEGRTGQLGYGVMAEQRIPKEVPGLTGVVAFVIGGESSLTGHCLALMSDGTVRAWGAAGSGQCGLPPESAAQTTHGLVIPYPTAIPGLSNIVAIAAGENHSLALDAEGRVYAFGNNGKGQLGLEPAGEVSPGVNAYESTPTEIPNLPKIVAIEAGLRFTVLLTESGIPLVFGDNFHGVLDSATEWSEHPHELPLGGVTQISAGEDSLAFALTGTVLGPCVELQKTVTPGTMREVWHAPQLRAKWATGIRPQVSLAAERDEWPNVVEGIPASAAHEHTFTGLVSGERYEVMMRAPGFGECLMEGAAA